MKQEILERVRNAFSTVIGVDAAKNMVPGATMEDVKGWDSLNFLNLIVALEDEFTIEMSTLEAASLNTVDAIITFIEQKTS